MRSKQVVDTGKRKPPNAGKGRPKGSLNRLTRNAKEAFEYAFTAVGDADGLAKWAADNLGDFYKLYARMIPVDTRHSAADGNALNFTLYVPPKDNTGR